MNGIKGLGKVDKVLLPVGFFTRTSSRILRIVNICEVMDLFLRKPFPFFLIYIYIYIYIYILLFASFFISVVVLFKSIASRIRGFIPFSKLFVRK